VELAVSHINLVSIHGNNLQLAVAPIDLHGEQSFFRFPTKANITAVQEEITGELHGDGASAPGTASPREVAQGGGEHTRKDDPPVFLEVLVFDRGDRVVQNLGTLLISHQNAPLQGEAAHKLAVIGVNLSDYVWAVRVKRANFRQVTGVNKKQPAGGPKEN